MIDSGSMEKSWKITNKTWHAEEPTMTLHEDSAPEKQIVPLEYRNTLLCVRSRQTHTYTCSYQKGEVRCRRFREYPPQRGPKITNIYIWMHQCIRPIWFMEQTEPAPACYSTNGRGSRPCSRFCWKDMEDVQNRRRLLYRTRTKEYYCTDAMIS